MVDQVVVKKLRDVMPYEMIAGEYHDTKAYAFRDVEVIEQHGMIDDQVYQPWPGGHKNVYFWVKLANGYSVAFNENPSRGWSFPVIKTK